MLLLLLVDLIRPLQALEVALIPSTGCYSHDVMMKEVGLSMPPGASITWIQAFLYDFGFGEIPLPANWTRLSIWGHDDEGVELMRSAGSLLWEQNVPTDFDRPWDLRGSFSFFKMLERHQTYCEKMLDDQRFLQYMRSQKTDVVLLDHFLQTVKHVSVWISLSVAVLGKQFSTISRGTMMISNVLNAILLASSHPLRPTIDNYNECMGGLAYLLNTSVVQFSNWPIADGYITSLNVPANPSATPKTGTPYSGLGMSFGERVGNLLFHWVIITARIIQNFVLSRMFARKGFPEVDIIRSEAERAIYAGRSEFLFDVVRPINNRVKYFGSNIQMNPSDYVTVIPELHENHRDVMHPQSGINCRQNIQLPNSTAQLPLSLSDCLCQNGPVSFAAANISSLPVRRTNLYMELDRSSVQQKFLEISRQFPELDWPSLTKEKFILVSFGSVAQAHYMPLDLVRQIFSAFAQTPYKVIWQTNSATKSLLWTRNISVPRNVIMTSWAPIKEMLAHPNLQYLICHGGINTINELLLFGVPVIGVHLQGDQGSNLRRLTDLGAAVMISIARIAQGQLPHTMRKFENNLERHWQRAAQLSSMLETYRTIHKDQQVFWIGWTARHGKSRTISQVSYVNVPILFFYEVRE
ncbi:glycosyltransferase family 28 protein [Ancylostoma ceylanicum]|uniref:glucuronosyltransferase n=1 Tax=Ancylostoma ceylanicum TaxID=53326 RepID=A0A0D6LJI3_9BILA|nr:glycosyltransferase family 28 protein [Ancylostoma ceylanicum]